MGLFDKLGSVIKGAGRLATGLIPGTLDDRLFDSAVSIFGGNGGASGAPPMPQLPAPRRRTGSGLVAQRDDDPVFKPSTIDFGPVEFDPGAAVRQFTGAGSSGSSGAAMMPSFNNALMSAMMAKSVRSKSGRAMLEAMMSGSLQGGMIQPTMTVETPRGVENHSPPGFRTVYVMGEPYAVFKPLAQTLGLLPKSSKAVVTRADLRCFRKAGRLGGKFKKLAKDAGYKVTNR